MENYISISVIAAKAQPATQVEAEVPLYFVMSFLSEFEECELQFLVSVLLFGISPEDYFSTSVSVSAGSDSTGSVSVGAGSSTAGVALREAAISSSVQSEY